MKFKLTVAASSFALLFFIGASSALGYYSCNAGPCNGTYTCNAGLTCRPDYGSTCRNNACPGRTDCCCPSCPGTCPGNQSDGCGGTCACVSAGPQQTPSVSSVTQNSCNSPGASVTVNWSFGATTQSCGAAWGYNCSGANNTFRINADGVVYASGIGSAVRTYQVNFASWGAHNVVVCANNGISETCSPASSFTLVQPACSVTAFDPTVSQCYSSVPTLSADFGDTCGNELQFGVDASNPFSGGWECNSGWAAGTSYYNAACEAAVGTGTHYWTATARSTASPAKCYNATTSTYSFQVDKTAPPVPGGQTFTMAANPACLGQYRITYDWNAVADTGCAGSAATPYWSQLSTNAAFSSVVSGWSNTWGSATDQTTASYYNGGTTLYGHVRSRDALDNQSAWSATTAVTIPTPTMFPPVVISGSFKEKVGTLCSSSMTVNPSDIVLSLSANPSLGVSHTCAILPGNASYSCTVTIDNQANPCAVANHDITVTASYPGYEDVGWTNDDTCTGSEDNTEGTVPPGGNITNDLIFDYGNQSWFKAANTSLVNKSTSARSNIIPNSIATYDSDDAASKYAVVGSAGTVLTDSSFSLGPNAQSGGVPTYSSSNWFATGYSEQPEISYTQYLDYVKARKEYKSIANISDINGNGVFVFSGNKTINASNVSVFNNRRVVLIGQSGTLTIQTNIIPASGYVAFVVPAISVDPAVTEIRGILVTDTINIGTSLTNPLKIKGNLYAQQAFTGERKRVDAQRPSFFVVFDAGLFVNLLPYLSTSTYEWRQLQ